VDGFGSESYSRRIIGRASQVEPSWDGNPLTSPEINSEIKVALQAFAGAGFAAAHADIENGGLQVPFLLHGALMSFFYAANVGTSAYSLLTIGATNLLMHHGSEVGTGYDLCYAHVSRNKRMSSPQILAIGTDVLIRSRSSGSFRQCWRVSGSGQ